MSQPPRTFRAPTPRAPPFSADLSTDEGHSITVQLAITAALQPVLQQLAQMQATLDMVEVEVYNTRMRMRNAPQCARSSAGMATLHPLKRERVVAGGDSGGAVGDLPPANLFPATHAELLGVGVWSHLPCGLVPQWTRQDP